MFLGFDHLVCDGMSIPNVVNDIHTAYTALCKHRDPVLPGAGSYLDFGHAQRSRYLSVRLDDPRLDRWKEFVKRNGGFFPPFPLELGIKPDHLYPIANVASKLLDAPEVDALETRCRAAGGKLFMGILAAVAISLHKAGGPDTYRGFMPVSERGNGSWTHSMGWFVNTLPIEFSVTDNTAFTDIIGRVRVAFTDMMGNIDIPFVKAWELLAPRNFTTGCWPYPVNFFSYIDFRKCPGGPNHPDWKPTMHIWASRSNGIASWFHRNTTGLYVNTVFADTHQAHQTNTTLEQILNTTLAEITHP